MSVGIDPSDLRKFVIAPALALIGLGGEAAEELMLGTALQESGCGRRLAQAAGPALGIWQMEPATHADIEKNFLLSQPALARATAKLLCAGIEPLFQLEGNLYYACAMARLVYRRVAAPLPAAGDVAAQAGFYKAHYNTAGGAATVAAYVANWKAACGAGVFT